MAQMALRAEENVGVQSRAPGNTPSAPCHRTAAVAVDLSAGGPQTVAENPEVSAESAPAHGHALTGGQVSSLVHHARGGDDRAFEALVRHYQSHIYSYLARMVPDPSEAEDLAQETFVHAYQALPRFQGEASFRTWLYRIASNLAVDASRRRDRRQWQTVSLHEPLDDGESPLARELGDGGFRAPGEAAASAALRDHVWSAISELSPKLRSLVILHDLQGLSYGETAQLLGCPLGTVKSRLFNARCQLRDKLRRRLPEDFLADLAAPRAPAMLGATVV